MNKVTISPDARLDITIITADECKGTYGIAIYGDRRNQTPVRWEPSEPELQTEQVNFHLSGSDCFEGHEEIDGDTWRELEAHGASDEFLTLLLNGKRAEEAANLCLATL